MSPLIYWLRSVLYYHRVASGLPPVRQRLLELGLHPVPLRRFCLEWWRLLHRSVRSQVRLSSTSVILTPKPSSHFVGSSANWRSSARNSQSLTRAPSAPVRRLAPRATTTWRHSQDPLRRSRRSSPHNRFLTRTSRIMPSTAILHLSRLLRPQANSPVRRLSRLCLCLFVRVSCCITTCNDCILEHFFLLSTMSLPRRS